MFLKNSIAHIVVTKANISLKFHQRLQTRHVSGIVEDGKYDMCLEL